MTEFQPPAYNDGPDKRDDQRSMRNAYETASLMMVYDLALRMSGLHLAASITEEQAHDVYWATFALRDRLRLP